MSRVTLLVGGAVRSCDVRAAFTTIIAVVGRVVVPASGNDSFTLPHLL
ncbi:hypothetical protein [Frankia sp. CiP3]|nr:hypothetical protein [Frankia sp. CiP3]